VMQVNELMDGQGRIMSDTVRVGDVLIEVDGFLFSDNSDMESVTSKFAPRDAPRPSPHPCVLFFREDVQHFNLRLSQRDRKRLECTRHCNNGSTTDHTSTMSPYSYSCLIALVGRRVSCIQSSRPLCADQPPSRPKYADQPPSPGAECDIWGIWKLGVASVAAWHRQQR